MRRIRLVPIVMTAALAAAIPQAVRAAFNGSISAASGRPGASVTVTSDDGPFTVGATGLYLLEPIEPSRDELTIDCPTAKGSIYLGAFSRTPSGAELTFRVPNTPAGTYEIRMNVPQSHPSCWRLFGFAVLGDVSSFVATTQRADQTEIPVGTGPLDSGGSQPSVVLLLGVLLTSGAAIAASILWRRARDIR